MVVAAARKCCRGAARDRRLRPTSRVVVAVPCLSMPGAPAFLAPSAGGLLIIAITVVLCGPLSGGAFLPQPGAIAWPPSGAAAAALRWGPQSTCTWAAAVAIALSAVFAGSSITEELDEASPGVEGGVVRASSVSPAVYWPLFSCQVIVPLQSYH